MNLSENANAIRILSADAVQKANSGHPGAPMGMADIATVLWGDFLRHNPSNPNWINRDRFILSNGHASMLLYSLLHLTGYDLSLDDLKSFRQLHSKTAGHPEYGITPGVETTTGPLGQGIANAVGMALAEKNLAAQFNKPSFELVDHFTYVFMGDGCLMEGISHEVCSLAGTLKLGKLIAFWDDNGISIDGHVSPWFSENVADRFKAYNWQVIDGVDGHDPQKIKNAISLAQNEKEKPTLICCKTTIGLGSPNKSGTHDCHGAPLGNEELSAVRKSLNWPHPPFEIPAHIYQTWDAKEKGQQLEDEWQDIFQKYQTQYPKEAKEFLRRIKGDLPKNWEKISHDVIHTLQANPQTIATRKASQNALEAFGHYLPELLGGSADLTPSNLTNWSGSTTITAESFSGNYLSYGVREFGMTAMMTGMALHGGMIPYGGTFLMFMEYAKNALRMAALMKQRAIYVFTHDSIGLGEDGPTHQPIEQIPSLRLTPNMQTWRPCDQVETAVAWKKAIERHDGPTSLILSRQNLPQFERDEQMLKQIEKGGYILSDSLDNPELILIATGSEVALAMAVKAQLSDIACRVISMPSPEVFALQSENYREQVLPNSGNKRLVIEMAKSDTWYKYVGFDGDVIGIDQFGESAPAEDLYPYFGFTVEQICKKAKKLLT